MPDQASRYFDQPNQVRMARAIESENDNEIVHLIRAGTVKPNDYRETSQVIPQYNFLAFATQFRLKKAMKALLAEGASPNSRTPEGISAMTVAATSPDSTLLPMLVDAGGDVNLRGRTNEPLSIDAFEAHRFDTLTYLLNHGINLDAQDNAEDTILSTCAALNAYDWMLDLLKRGANPKIPMRGASYRVGLYVQQSAGRVTPEFEAKRQQVIAVLKQQGIMFPVPEPPHWDSRQHRYVEDRK